MDWTLLVAGFGGGLARGLVGFTKHQYAYKNVKFEINYFLAMVFISGVIGLLAGTLVGSIIALNGVVQATNFYVFLAGYAGGDFIENVYKIVAKKEFELKLPNLLGGSKATSKGSISNE